MKDYFRIWIHAVAKIEFSPGGEELAKIQIGRTWIICSYDFGIKVFL